MAQRIVRGAGIFGALAASLALASSATATSPGQNGPIVWNSFLGGPPYEVWIMNPDGTGQDQLTDNEWHDERAQISADRSKITFMSFRTPADDSTDIYVMDADGSNQTNLTNNADSEYEPTWSPNGNTIAFTRQGPGFQDIFSMPAAGGTADNLTNTPITYECCPEYSPDGMKIAFTNSGHTKGDAFYDNNEIWVMNADGTDQQQLTTTDDSVQNVGPTWSPDGNKIAWARDGAIWTMNADGTSQAPLTAFSNYYAPVWSPDGTRIAAQCNSDICSVGVANPDSDIQDLTAGNMVQDEYPSWAPAAGGGGELDTVITRRPDDVIAVRRATYRFKARPPAGATFRCKLDQGNYQACTSPKTYMGLSNGRHTFRVRAKAGGQQDPTPAMHSFRVQP